MTGSLLFPNIDPIAFQIGPFAVRWYALAYIAGLIAGWVYILWLLRRAPKVMTREQVGDFLTWAILGVILGGRLGYIIFYHPDYYVCHVQEIFYVWEGGMSFHGGFLGLTGAVILYCRKKQLSFWSVADLIAAALPQQHVDDPIVRMLLLLAFGVRHETPARRAPRVEDGQGGGKPGGQLEIFGGNRAEDAARAGKALGVRLFRDVDQR